MISRLAALRLQGTLLDMQILRTWLRHTGSETLGVDTTICVLAYPQVILKPLKFKMSLTQGTLYVIQTGTLLRMKWTAINKDAQ